MIFTLDSFLYGELVRVNHPVAAFQATAQERAPLLAVLKLARGFVLCLVQSLPVRIHIDMEAATAGF
jgi:hypothetical protein